jgi:replicative DNA helicase
MHGHEDEEGAPPPDRTPANIEAEAALLGALMLSNDLLDSVGHLPVEAFHEPIHQRIYGAIIKLRSHGSLATPITVKGLLPQDDAYAAVGGFEYLIGLVSTGAGIIGAKDFARQIRDLYELRKLRDLAFELVEASEGYDIDLTAKQVMAEFEAKASEIMLDTEAKTTSTFADAFDSVTGELEDIERGADPAGFHIKGYLDWNAVAGRMEEADFILLGGRPGMGKTGVSLAVALGAAQAGVGVDYLSLEMDRRKTTRRALANMMYQPGVTSSYQHLIDGKLTRDDWRAIGAAREQLEALPFTISDPAFMYVEDFAAHVRKLQKQFEKKGQTLKLVVMDYIQRLGTRKRFTSETEAMGYISRLLKAACKECGIALIALTQLSRALEQRDNKRPMLADLRQSGSLEQDADTVIFVFREEYYLERNEPSKDKMTKWEAWAGEISEVRDHLELYSSKRREGGLAKRVSRFVTKHQAIRDADDPQITNAPSFFDMDRR